MNVDKVIILTMCLPLFLGIALSAPEPKTLPSSPDDLFVIFPNDRYGCIDRLGNIVIPARYDFMGDCKEGLIPGALGSGLALSHLTYFSKTMPFKSI